MKRVKDLLKCTLKDKLWFLISSMLIISGIYIIGNIFSGDFYNLKDLKFVVINSFFVISLFCICSSQYKDYKLSSQLGFSRTTFWKSKITELLIISVLATIYGVIVLKVGNIGTGKFTALVSSIAIAVLVGISTLFALVSLCALYHRLGKLLVFVFLYFAIAIGLKFSRYFQSTFGYLFVKLFNSNFYLAFFSAGILWIVIMFGCSFLFTNRLQLKEK